MEKLWTTAEVAKYLEVQEVDVEQLVKQGKLTGYKLGGQFLRFRPEQVEGLKGTIQFRPNSAMPHRGKRSWISQLTDLVYIYDFYIVSAALLIIVVIYLVVG
ncbi:MAG: helix-turn-helix domain-containing protein [Candidatus Omnitrophica bacterium]|nr:helix-turn-helix domain-containing protein [Candidatus Omnitrophota bacterium]MBI2173606.1 helix-turn-helix domain-containing protein [Candidatus Omnitrophota bacterium]MBI3010356.1 helix-turn-helix domain-containing protein [Candidatus Omnitrophota bacterium]